MESDVKNQEKSGFYTPIRKNDRSWVRTNKEKAEAFADYLENVFKPYPSQDLRQEEEIRTFLDTPFQMALPVQAKNIREVSAMIKNLNPKKTPGYDIITG